MFRQISLPIILLIAALTIGQAQETEKQFLRFGQNSYALSKTMQNQLKAIVHKSKFQNLYGIKVSVPEMNDGHSIYQNMLHKKRKNEIYRYLVIHGINSELIEFIQPEHDDRLSATNHNPGWMELTVNYKNSVPDEFKVAQKDFQVNAAQANAIELDHKGTIMHIPENCFVDNMGNVVTGVVNLQFKEYTNSAAIAFSGIPMTFKSGNTEYNFNSSGMFEITGTSEGKDVHIAKGKSLKIDYVLAKLNPDISFFKLNEDKSGWNKLNDLTPVKVNLPEQKNAIIRQQQDIWNNPNIKGINQMMVRNLNINNLNLNDQAFGEEVIAVDNGNRTQGTLLAEGADAGHTYPDIVKGLNVDGFGVYNCDQIYRVANRVNINASYVDERGNNIENLHVLSLIDLNYNGAFSFSPNSFTCDAKGKNVLALFTTNGQLYLLDQEGFDKSDVSKGGNVTFTMKNMTNQIKSHEDLADYLGIKI